MRAQGTQAIQWCHMWTSSFWCVSCSCHPLPLLLFHGQERIVILLLRTFVASPEVLQGVKVFPAFMERKHSQEAAEIYSEETTLHCILKEKKNDLLSWNHTGNCSVTEWGARLELHRPGGEKGRSTHVCVFAWRTPPCEPWNRPRLAAAVLRELSEAPGGSLLQDCSDSGKAAIAHERIDFETSSH